MAERAALDEAAVARRLGAAAAAARTRPRRWRVREVVGDLLRVAAPEADADGFRIGELVEVVDADGRALVAAEVVGFAPGAALLAPIGAAAGVGPGCEAIGTGAPHRPPVGPALAGRVVDGMGRPLDAARRGPLGPCARAPAEAAAPDPLTRPAVTTPLDTGVRAIDGLLTLGQGQRIGLFAAAGVGKSTLLASLAKGAIASGAVDRVVIALVGERGREVREFLDTLDPATAAAAATVVATSDRSAMERIKAASTATAIAERFRDGGERVLLLMDSVTRYARALREVGLAAGEPPTRRGYPPSVFARLPQLIERAGPTPAGAITAIYTVLVEGDDMAEPVADEVRSIVDGHIVLSRKLAAAGRYPAIDAPASASRVMRAVTTPERHAAAASVRGMLAKLDEIELLVRLGEYRTGADPVADRALERRDALEAFLTQPPDTPTPIAETLARLSELAA